MKTQPRIQNMKEKKPLVPHRVRRVPAQFSWVDQRLVGDRHFQCCQPQAWGLYLFLLVVGDAQGMSYYSEAAIRRHLQLELADLRAARDQLIQARLIAYRKPFYQVLDLDPQRNDAPGSRTGQAVSLAELFEKAMNGAAR